MRRRGAAVSPPLLLPLPPGKAGLTLQGRKAAAQREEGGDARRVARWTVGEEGGEGEVGRWGGSGGEMGRAAERGRG